MLPKQEVIQIYILIPNLPHVITLSFRLNVLDSVFNRNPIFHIACIHWNPYVPEEQTASMVYETGVADFLSFLRDVCLLYLSHHL